MKIKKLTKRLTKEYGIPDGFVRIDSITLSISYDDINYITIHGVYGIQADGTVDQHNFELFLREADGKNYEYIAGMFAELLMNDDE